MTEKIGRKALFIGVPEKKEQVEESFAKMRISELVDLIEKGLEGDFSGRISVKGPDDELTSLSTSLNTFFSRIEKYAERCTIYRRAFEQQPAPTIIKDSSGSKILSNPSYDSLEEAAVTSLEKQGVGSESMVSFVFQDRNPHTREIQIPLQDGDTQLIEERSIPLVDDKGVYAVLFSLNDISAYKKMERQMRQQPEIEEFPDLFMERILGDNLVPALVVDTDLKISASNDAFSQLSGIAPKEVISMNLHDIHVLGCSGHDIEDILANDSSGAAEITFDFPSGPRVVWQYGTIIPEYAEMGKQVILLYIDITGQKHEESLLLDQVQELRASLLKLEEKNTLSKLEEEKARTMDDTTVAEEDETVQIVAEEDETVQIVAEEDETVQIAAEEDETVQIAAEGEKTFETAVEQPPSLHEPDSMDSELQKTSDIGTPPAPTPDITDNKPKELSPTSTIPAKVSKKESSAPAIVHDVVEFELAGENYALDIGYAREIVEMMPITPIPRAPQYLKGVMNLRGEITNIIDINNILGVAESSEVAGKKIIVLSSEATGGENIGIIVDGVHSVIQIQDTDIEHLGEGISELSDYMKGIIKISGRGLVEKKGEKSGDKYLIIWIDVLKVLSDLLQQGSTK